VSGPILVTSIARKWLDEGLGDRGITRDLRWGIPVDRPGFEDKVFYVWFDAPIEYIGATKEWADAQPGGADWRGWWDAEGDVRYTQFMAKDNIPFHTISFPATIVGSREPWKLADYIKGFNWLNYYGGKFSTSRGVGVFMDQALELLPADDWRWYLIANAPESDDTSFTWELFAATVNKDLAGNLGNFVNRTLTFTARRFGEQVPEGADPGELERELEADLAAGIAVYTGHLERMEFRKAAQRLREVWALGNVYLEKAAPWTAVKEHPEQAALALRTAINLIRVFALLAAPIIPDTAGRVLTAIGRSASEPWPEGALDALRPGDPFTVPDVLFRKITPDDVAAWTERFGGPEDA
jgi:methionyl-tRNA synthetase